jgi:hypothetical protein
MQRIADGLNPNEGSIPFTRFNLFISKALRLNSRPSSCTFRTVSKNKFNNAAKNGGDELVLVEKEGQTASQCPTRFSSSVGYRSPCNLIFETA